MRELSEKTFLIYLDIEEIVGMLRTDQAEPEPFYERICHFNSRIIFECVQKANEACCSWFQALCPMRLILTTSFDIL